MKTKRSAHRYLASLQAEDVRPARVMVVDGDPHLRRLVEVTLSRPGLYILSVSSGREALGLLAQGAPDVLVLEPRLPDMDGFALLRRLRRNPGSAHTTVILLSNLTSVVDQAYGFALGAAAYLTKPFSPLALIREVESAVQVRAGALV